ncbi:hypothetical protein BE221DRAFT_200766 [Ostreococcus tauri]|uniref:Uncharacterized protein n=1 Tax=Ostreococcus tauri TaxID=70448 RepID=A0A1Y5I832_OSTTA|nr:hypothetical protein BE221DRAFT_200766 [Ostreococcus tauri]
MAGLNALRRSLLTVLLLLLMMMMTMKYSLGRLIESSVLEFFAGSTDLKIERADCSSLQLPQRRGNIPLPAEAFSRDRGLSVSNFMVASTRREPRVLLTLPAKFMGRVDRDGTFDSAGNSDNTYKRAKESQSHDGIFIDVGGWIGDSSFQAQCLV